jgi:cyanophycinase
VGFVLLEGGNEFKAGMAAADRRAMAVAGGQASPIRIIPAAAAPDDNDLRAGANAVAWFQGLGATDVRALPITDRGSAGQPGIGRELEAAGVVFMLGGFTRHLAETLEGSPAWEAIKSAHRAGAVVGGSSAGAMVLCEFYFDPASGKVLPGLNLLPHICVLPHHDTFGQEWAPRLAPLLPGSLLVGIDEETGLLNDGPHGQWTVYGRGAVTLYKPDGRAVFHHGQRLGLPVEVNDRSLNLELY